MLREQLEKSGKSTEVQQLDNVLKDFELKSERQQLKYSFRKSERHFKFLLIRSSHFLG
jgi:hypothetical protein